VNARRQPVAQADVEASYLITFRDVDGSRRPLLEAVIEWLRAFPKLEIVVVEQDAVRRLNPDPLGPGIRYFFAPNDGPFNKAWGLNVAARHARHGILVTGDADMVMPVPALARALYVCREYFDAVNPYAGIVDLTGAETRSVLDNGIEGAQVRRPRVVDRLPEREYLCFCGGICVYRREVYFRLGGMDERFLGWGGEDDAMSTNLMRFTGSTAVQKDTVAWHLWHPRVPGRFTHRHYRRNVELAQWYRDCPEEDLVRWRSLHGDGMGDASRYVVKR